MSVNAYSITGGNEVNDLFMNLTIYFNDAGEIITFSPGVRANHLE